MSGCEYMVISELHPSEKKPSYIIFAITNLRRLASLEHYCLCSGLLTCVVSHNLYHLFNDRIALL